MPNEMLIGGRVAALLVSQYLPRNALSAIQARRLRALVEHAWHNVPFYRTLWERHGVRPEHVRSCDDLRRLPRPERRDLELYQDDLLSRRHREAIRAHRGHSLASGGSSGGPRLETHYDRASWDQLHPFYFREMFASRYPIRAPLLYYWGLSFEERVYNRLGLVRKFRVNPSLSEEEQLRMMEEHPGARLFYHPTALFAMARRFRERLGRCAPSHVVSTAELLTDSMRRAIGEATNAAPIYDFYATTELARVAFECPAHEGLHVNVESVILEILDDDDLPVRDGECGRIVATGLLNFAMPLIRYDLGDLAVRTNRRCSCGRTLPMIERIEGRAKDVVRLPDGGTRTPRDVLEALTAIDHVEQVRVTVESATFATIAYVSSHEKHGSVAAALGKAFARVCPGITAPIHRVDNIEKTPGGKRVMMKSALPSRHVGCYDA